MFPLPKIQGSKGSKASGSGFSESKKQTSSSGQSDKGSSLVPKIDFDFLSKRLIKIIGEFTSRFEAAQIKEIGPISSQYPFQAVFCDVELTPSALEKIRDGFDYFKLHSSSVVKTRGGTFQQGPLSIYFFHGKSEYGFLPLIRFSKQSIVYYNGADTNQVDLSSVSKKVIRSVWISPEFFNETTITLPPLPKEYFQLREDILSLKKFTEGNEERMSLMKQEIRQEVRQEVTLIRQEIKEGIIEMSKLLLNDIDERMQGRR